MYLYERPAAFLQSHNLGQPAPSPASPDLVLDDFDFDRADLKQKHRNAIDQLAQQIVDSWKPASTRPAFGVRIVGHTDEVGSDEYNLKLGRRRAEKVGGRLTGLIIGGDVDTYQRMTWSVESRGRSQRKPGVPANKNRRVEIFIEWGRVKPPPPPPPPRRPDPYCVAECQAQQKRCLRQSRFVPDCLIGFDRCIRGCAHAPVTASVARSGRDDRLADDVPTAERDPLPYREALEQTERKQREEYLRDCANVRVLQTLEKQARTPGERVRWLERKVAAMPRIVEGHALIRDLIARRRAGRLSGLQLRNAIVGVLNAFPEVREFPFPSGYAVGSVADETAKARCELSRARWEFLVWNRTGKVPGRLVR